MALGPNSVKKKLRPYDDEKWDCHLFEVGNKGKDHKGECHHAKSDVLNDFAAETAYRERCNGIARSGEHREDT